MQTDVPGTPCLFEALAPGECFAFRIEGHQTIGLRLKDAASEKMSLVAVLARLNDPKAEPSVGLKGQPDYGAKLEATLECQWDARVEVRDGVGNPRPGQVILAGERTLLCFRNVARHNDPRLIDLKAGEFVEQAIGPAIVFQSWSLVLRPADNQRTTLHHFEVPAANP